MHAVIFSFYSGGRCCYVNLPEGVLSELLYADDLFLKSEAIEGLRNKFLKWKYVFESKGLKCNLGQTKVMVCDASQRMAYIKVKLIHVGFAACK